MNRWEEREPYIRLIDGKTVTLAKPTKEDYRNIPIIAHNLAGVFRYSGGSRFSVAQHEVVGARMAALFYPEAKLLPARFLIHDNPEAFIGDVSSPLKALLPQYKVIEAVHDLAVEGAYDLLFVGDALVKEVDNRMWLTEREMVYMHCDADISEDTAQLDLEPFELTLTQFLDNFSPWACDYAEEQYLIEFRRLLPWVDW